MFDKLKQTVRAFKDGKEIPADMFFESINIECSCGAKFRAGIGIYQKDLAEKFIDAHKLHTRDKE